MNKLISICMILTLLVSALVSAAGSQQGANIPDTGVDAELIQAGQGTGQGVETNAEVMKANQGAETNVQVQERVRAGNYVGINGEQVQVQAGEGNQIKLRVRDVEAHSDMEITSEQSQERTRLSVKLSNGKGAEIKVMPDTASERARERLSLKVCSSENNCSIELKEVGTGQQVRAAYEIKAEKEAKVLGLFRAKMQVQAQVDAENGEVIQAKRPWWSFLATEE